MIGEGNGISSSRNNSSSHREREHMGNGINFWRNYGLRMSGIIIAALVLYRLVVDVAVDDNSTKRKSKSNANQDNMKEEAPIPVSNFSWYEFFFVPYNPLPSTVLPNQIHIMFCQS